MSGRIWSQKKLNLINPKPMKFLRYTYLLHNFARITPIAMDTKLTLKLDKFVIDKAKDYAASNRRSLSRIIEAYLRSLTSQDEAESKDDIQISPFVKSLSSGVHIPSDFDYKNEYYDHLSDKHQ